MEAEVRRERYLDTEAAPGCGIELDPLVPGVGDAFALGPKPSYLGHKAAV
jgi:hypothetical protein